MDPATIDRPRLDLGDPTGAPVGALPRRLLGVWAHPDDECYLSAGLMARVVDAGGTVRVVCATRGELGTDDPALRGTRRFAAARQDELVRSLATLGVTDVHVLGLPDGGCDAVDDDHMAAVVADHIAAVEPEVVVTFGPDGITGHADHLAVSRWTTAAATAAPGTAVRWATVTHAFARRHRSMHDELGLFADLEGGRAASVPDAAVALRCSLDDAELDRKRAALACHASQTIGLAELVGEDAYRRWWRDECFRRADPQPEAAVAAGRSAATLEAVR